MGKLNTALILRQLFANKLYSLINLIGLGLASAFCILVYFYIQSEENVDNFHSDLDRLYRIELTGMFAVAENSSDVGFFETLSTVGSNRNSVLVPLTFAQEIETNFPEIEYYSRFIPLSSPVIQANEQHYQEADNVTYADENFFEVFNFPLLKGAPETVMEQRSSVVISQRLASKYFKDENPIGKTIVVLGGDSSQRATISGIMKDFPINSSMQFDLILPIESNANYREMMNNGVYEMNSNLIVKLKESVDTQTFLQKLNDFSHNYFGPLSEMLGSGDAVDTPLDNVFLRPFKEIHYYGAWGHQTNLLLIYQLSMLAVLILFIACFNYILLSLTNSLSQSKELVVRKILGASHWQIAVRNFFSTQILVVLAVIVGFFVAFILFPSFNQLTGARIALSQISLLEGLTIFVLLSVVLGVISRTYPSFIKGKFTPLKILKGSTYKINPGFSKFLIVIQFSLCMTLIISCFVINKQIRYVKNAELGFDKENVIIVHNPYDYSKKKESMQLKESINHFARSQPEIIGFTSTSSMYDRAPTSGLLLNGESSSIDLLNIDYGYFDFTKIPMVLGREFSRDIVRDTATVAPHVVVNQTLYRLLGEPLLDAYHNELSAVIIGVCRDYHNRNLTEAIRPTLHTLNRETANYYWLKIGGANDVSAVLKKLEEEFSTTTNRMPFRFSFLDHEVEKSYRSYVNWLDTVTVSCIIAIFIACLGLFGLSSILTMNKAKEISIKKVLGASVFDLFFMLNRENIKMMVVSFLIAVPLALILCNEWLKNFAYRIEPDILIIFLSGLIAVTVAFFAVSYHTVRAAKTNPLKNLRNE